jgi:hypothetical protein
MFVVDDCLDRRGPAYIGKLLDALASYNEFNDADPRDDHGTGIFTLGRTRIAFKISGLEVFKYVPAGRTAGYDDLPSVGFSRVS